MRATPSLTNVDADGGAEKRARTGNEISPARIVTEDGSRGRADHTAKGYRV